MAGFELPGYRTWRLRKPGYAGCWSAKRQETHALGLPKVVRDSRRFPIAVSDVVRLI